jgi:alkylation response protein AidB-like acyl-CoA dehydrogenase
MPPALTEDQRALQAATAAFAETRIAPFARTWEKAGTFPRASLQEAAALGLGGLCVPEALGGAGLSRSDAVIVFETLAMACPSFAAFLSIHNMCTTMIAQHATASARERFLPHLIAMDSVASYCLTEPGCGSDAAALQTRAVANGNLYALTGTKSFISGGGYSDLYVVMCRTGGMGPGGISAILVPNGTAGLSFGAQEDKMGWRAQPTAQVVFDDCRVPAEYLLGVEGQGFSYAMHGLDGGRLNIAACSLGGAEQCLQIALGYMADRRAFGRRLDQFDALRFRVADMATELQAARALLRQAAQALDAGHRDATMQVAMAKRFATDAGFLVANDALQLLGGYGYLADFGIEKIVRDLRVHQILEGSNEIMRVIIARNLIGTRP